MKIYCPRHSGFCFGVKRAIKMALKAAQSGKMVYSLGPLIHNPLVVEELKKKGVITVRKLSDFENKNIIIRSHGIHPNFIRKLKHGKYNIIDATCPKVRQAQMYVEKLVREGYYIVIVGEKDHPEVRGLLGYAGKKSEIYHDKIKLETRRIGVVPQTTLDIERLNQAVSYMMPAVLEMKIFNTICYETRIRINEALEIARKADVMLIVGGKNSANTTRLFEICSKYKPSYHIESAGEILPQWLKGKKSVGIAAGASTPRKHIRDIVRYLRKRFC